jgi:ABC-type sugar transport system substrate-binding protein
VFTPLAKKPKPGGYVIKIVTGSLPADVAAAKNMQKAAATIGWRVKIVVTDGSVEQINQAWTAAIAEHPTAISGASPQDQVKVPLAAATKAGIITELEEAPQLANAATGPTTVNNGGNKAFTLLGQINANLVLRDSNCGNGNTLVVTLPFPNLTDMANTYKTTLTARCPSCKVEVQTVNNSDVGSPAATSAVVSALQSDPSIKYVFCVIGALGSGIPAALQAAGISGVKIFGALPDTTSVQALNNRTNSWWLTQEDGATNDGWFELDGILRAAAAGPGKAWNEPGNYVSVLTPANIPPNATQPSAYPSDYIGLFKHLWHAG